MTDKATLRRLARLRSPPTPEESHRVVLRLVGLVDGATTGCVYLPMAGELDVVPVTEHRSDLEWFTTRTADRTTLTIHPIASDLEVHPFGYRQPVAGSVDVDPSVIDVWIVPGVAFDATGHRLGHGMGYYDRVLAHARPDSLFIGATTERRLFPMIPSDEFDVVMDVIVTEDRVIRP